MHLVPADLKVDALKNLTAADIDTELCDEQHMVHQRIMISASSPSTRMS
jgi:hypothetical protein